MPFYLPPVTSGERKHNKWVSKKSLNLPLFFKDSKFQIRQERPLGETLIYSTSSKQSTWQMRGRMQKARTDIHTTCSGVWGDISLWGCSHHLPLLLAWRKSLNNACVGLFSSKSVKFKCILITLLTIPGEHWMQWKVIAKSGHPAPIPKYKKNDHFIPVIITNNLRKKCFHGFTVLRITFLSKFTLSKNMIVVTVFKRPHLGTWTQRSGSA